MRLAFVTSVRCRPVSFQISQLSIVPNSTSPRSPRSRSPSTWSSSQASFEPAKYGASGSPVRSRKFFSPNASSKRRSWSPVRVSCQTIAWCTGVPVSRSQTRVVSRWLVMPTAAICSAVISSTASASWITNRTHSQISSASCSTQPGRGKICRCSRCATETMVPDASKTMQRDDVVP